MKDQGRPSGLLLAAVVGLGLAAIALVFSAGQSNSTPTIAPAPLAATAPPTTTRILDTPTSTVVSPPTTSISFPPPATVEAAPGWRAAPGGPARQRFGATPLWTSAGLLIWGGGSVDGEVTAATTLYHRQIGGNPWVELPESPLPGGSESLLVENATTVLAFSKTGAARYDIDGEQWDPPFETPLAQPLSGSWTGTETLVVGVEQRAPGVARLSAIAIDPNGGCCRLLAEPPIDLNRGWTFWTGDRLLLIGGRFDGNTNAPIDDRPGFAEYDPATDQWTVLPSPNLEGVQALAAEWNGTELIVWDYLTQAAVWHPERGWRELPNLPFDQTECYPEGAAAHGKVFAFSCGQAAYFDGAADRWVQMWAPPWESVTSGWCSPAGTADETTDVYLWCAPSFGGQPVLWEIDLDRIETIAVSRPAEESMWELVPHPEWSDRAWASLVWTDTELIVWGGFDGAEEILDGWAYEPSSGRLHRIPDSGPPGGRVGQTAVWTGDFMAVWRGDVDTWDPNRLEWAGGSRVAGPLVHPGNTALWTGDEILFWGTRNWYGASERGAGYNLDEWRELPTSPLEPRSNAVVVWSGDGRYVWANDAMYVWGGFVTGGPNGIQPAQDGARYSPVDDAWQWLPDLPEGVHLEHPVGGFVAGEFIVVGVDRRRSGDVPVVTGAAYDPMTNTWRAIADLPGPIVDGEGLAGSIAAVAAGDELAVWLPQWSFGDEPGIAFYSPDRDEWTRHHGAPADAYSPQLVWTGEQVAALTPAGLVLLTP